MKFEVGKIYVWGDATPNDRSADDQFRYVGDDPNDGLPLFQQIKGRNIYAIFFQDIYGTTPLIGFINSHKDLIELKES